MPIRYLCCTVAVVMATTGTDIAHDDCRNGSGLRAFCNLGPATGFQEDDEGRFDD